MIVLIGKTASGKTTTAKCLCEKYNKHRVITYTSRPPRKGEVDGVDYYFITDNEFNYMVSNDFFAEKARYNDWQYGSIKNDYYNDSVVVLTPSGLRNLRKKIIDIPIYAVYIDIPRKDRLIASLNRCSGSNKDIEEIKRRDGSDLGQFDGVEEEVDLIISNPKYLKTPEMICDEIMDFIAKVSDEKSD